MHSFSPTLTPIRIVILLGVISIFGVVISLYVNIVNPFIELIQHDFQRSQSTRERNNLEIENLKQELNALSASQRNAHAEKNELTKRIEVLAHEQAPAVYESLMTIKSSYEEILDISERNTSVGLSTISLDDKKKHWGELLLTHQFDGAQKDLQETKTILDAEYAKYIASLPTPTPQPVVVKKQPATGYSYESVVTSNGTFGVDLIKLPKSYYTIKTLAANNTDCTDGCPTKSLSEYVSSVNGYAGMNGSYFCPPDYASCVGAINSYDYPVFDSSNNTWLNKSALSWNNIGLATFNGDSSIFYRSASSLNGASVTAGISNFPTILVNGQTSFTDEDTTSYQETTKGARGVLGVDAQYYYLAIATNATVTDLPEICTALGMTDVLNLDGGGSSALYINGGYVVGPGRFLPNAVVLVPK